MGVIDEVVVGDFTEDAAAGGAGAFDSACMDGPDETAAEIRGPLTNVSLFSDVLKNWSEIYSINTWFS